MTTTTLFLETPSSWLYGILTTTVKKKCLPESVTNIVCAYFSVPAKELETKSRFRELVTARQIAMFLIKKHCSISLKSIGLLFNRDHTTVIHSIITVTHLTETNVAYARDVQAMENLVVENSVLFGEVDEKSQYKPRFKKIRSVKPEKKKPFVRIVGEYSNVKSLYP